MTDRGMTPELIWRLALLLFVLPFSGPTTAAPQVGELAPPWTLSGSDGQQHSLAELRGQHVVIAFFPKAYTSG